MRSCEVQASTAPPGRICRARQLHPEGASSGGLADQQAGAPRVGEGVEGDAEDVAEAHDGAEGGGRQAAYLNLAEGLGGHAGGDGDLDEAAAGASLPEGDAKALAGRDLLDRKSVV